MDVSWDTGPTTGTHSMPEPWGYSLMARVDGVWMLWERSTIVSVTGWRRGGQIEQESATEEGTSFDDDDESDEEDERSNE